MERHRAVEIRDFTKLNTYTTKDESIETKTSIDQKTVERSCLHLFVSFDERESSVETLDGENPVLNVPSTRRFLLKGLDSLSSDYQCLDASRPWLLYWILHSLELIGETVTCETKIQNILRLLSRCQNEDGGFGGGPGQISHLAPTYAAVNAICILGVDEGYRLIDREKLAHWMKSLQNPDGSFLMHLGGEVDIRGTYCALSVARLINIYSENLFAHTAHWIVECQTYEGGFGGVPGMEAHGGYSFCGLGALILMDRHMLCNLDLLLRWASRRQMKLEGGFQGRTNKLVDGCYSFWQGGIFPLLHDIFSKDETKKSCLSSDRWMFSQEALQEYLLICCQDKKGGLIDKPGKHRDYYHTCYALSGLSVAQHFGEHKYVYGPKMNELKETHPLFNIGVEAASKALYYFEALPVPVVN